MLRHPPRSTLFPTRRSSDLGLTCRYWVCPLWRPGFPAVAACRFQSSLPTVSAPHPPCAAWREVAPATPAQPHLQQTRSEEHTSELQSRPHLVCRLLLEKKKI